MLQLMHHGGLCCGVKTIHGFGYGESFDSTQSAITEIPPYVTDGTYLSYGKSFFYKTAPVETALERLDRYLAYLKKKRPGGLVEVTLTDNDPTGKGRPSGVSQMAWQPILEERGFKSVNSFRNSNSGAVVTVFHLVMDWKIVLHPVNPEPSLRGAVIIPE